ncbi:MAG: HAD-IIIA family hydrolase [Thermodesulfovibrionales bacterium]|nr:HAD-IIIA family hydrolase [Thermodesulfovibrionales bacterium]
MDIEKLKDIAKSIKLLILDVDGVLTDGSIILDDQGNEIKSFYVRDGHGIKMLTHIGVQVAIITGRYSKVVERRAEELGIKEVYQRCHSKTVAYEHLVEKLNIKDSEIAYVGDDIVDIPIMKKVALPVAVADAEIDTKASAIYITKKRGGKGAVREVCELIIKAKGKWEGLVNDYD